MYKVQYYKKGSDSLCEASFQNLEDAQLWWDSIYYLRDVYIIVEARPR